MPKNFDPVENYEKTKKLVGYLPKKQAKTEVYSKLGFKCGLEIHQQLKTKKKLFCRCPAGLYQDKNDYDAEIVRHMRPTLSELGEYDGTALMEFKTKKNIFYRIKNESACTYDIDDTPPFLLNDEALRYALEIALLLKTSIVGELHITRKQYLDGSIPTGFQRTGIIGIEGEIPLSNKKVRIIQLSLEEDACREVSDEGHKRVYTTDRLGMPLIETVTYPELLTPEEAAEAGHYLRYLVRSTGNVRTGIGAAREDVNVSITGGTRVEIKGVAHIKWIPKLTHIEAFRQKALLEIKRILNSRIKNIDTWNIKSIVLLKNHIRLKNIKRKTINGKKQKIVAVNLPHFGELLSFFTQPGKVFADEISDRIKVIACLEKPNLTHSEDIQSILNSDELEKIKELLNAEEGDAQIIFWTTDEDLQTALESIEERCRLAYFGVPNETRKGLPDGTNIFERVLPGPDRMYPDTDSAPIQIKEELIRELQNNLPLAISDQMKKLKKWEIPEDSYNNIFIRNLFTLLYRIINDFDYPATFVGKIVGQTMKHIEGQYVPSSAYNYDRIYDLFSYIKNNGLEKEIIFEILPIAFQYPNMDICSILLEIGFKRISKSDILKNIPALESKFKEIRKSSEKNVQTKWIMGELRTLAIGNINLCELKAEIDGVK